MKSKRVLTMLLSLAIMLSFMPSMAFAASPGTASEGHDFTIKSDKSNVEYKIEPTCTTPGIAVVTCTKSHGGVQCKATNNQDVEELGHEVHRQDAIIVTAEEFAAQMVKQGKSEDDAKEWLEGSGKQICTGRVYTCENCGKYFVRVDNQFFGYTYQEATFKNFTESSRSTEHVAPTGTPACAATFDCVVCGKKGVSNRDYNALNSAVYHGLVTIVTDEDGKQVVEPINPWTPNEHFAVKTPEYKVHYIGDTGEKNVYATVYKCKTCDLEMRTSRYEGADIEDFEHKNTYTVSEEADCTHAGYTNTYCSDCGYLIKGEGKGALGHSWSSAEQTIYPADEYDGDLVAKVCTRCGEVDWANMREVTLPIKHNVTATVVAPASCLDCTWILVQCTNPICKMNAQGAAHKQAFFVKSKDDVEKVGNKYYVTYDGEKVEVPFAEATGHTWGDKKELHGATCTTKAQEGRTCTVCGAINHNSVRDTSPALGHEIEEVVVPATCGEYGYTYKICNRCNLFFPETVQNGNKVAEGYEKLTDDLKYNKVQPVVKLGTKCTYEWQVLEESTYFKKGTRAKVCTVCNHLEEATKESIAEKKIAAPKVKALKKKAKVTVKAVPDAVKYQIVVNGKVVKKNAKAGKTYTIKKKNLKLGKKNKFQIVAFDANGVKATSKAKSVKIKKK